MSRIFAAVLALVCWAGVLVLPASAAGSSGDLGVRGLTTNGRVNPLGIGGEDPSPASRAPGVRFLRMENGAAVFEVGSGSYAFAVDR